MNYKRGDVVILAFPFFTHEGVTQKARPALVISDHSIIRRFNDIILAAITSKRIDQPIEMEFLLCEGSKEFKESGLKKTSIIRGEFIITVPAHIIQRSIGQLSKETMEKIDSVLELSLGL